MFLPRPEANGKITLDFLDLTYGLCSGRIAPHALNQLAHAFRDRQKFGEDFFHASLLCLNIRSFLRRSAKFRSES